MENIMKQIRELKDEIAYLEADYRQLGKCYESVLSDIDELRNKYHLYQLYSSVRFIELNELRMGMRMRMSELWSKIEDKKDELRKLRRAAYHTEGECRYYLLDLNDIAEVIDKSGFIRAIKF